MNLNNLQEEINKIKLINQGFKDLVLQFKKIIIIGNGGSNAIASHISVDYTKWLNIPTFSFSDSSMLTAYVNDFGIENAYKQFLINFASPDTFIILISSSGNSMNIVNAAKYCEENNFTYAGLSGFDFNNKLNNMNANFKYHVNYKSYGVVEIAHETLLHSIVIN
jgi:D-sedoheptulose 7-phosphate isomerase